ncbi:S9 family peptidase, partial [Riemerella anatipestifer]|nr:S9 family peptidase [Riemerella anatipestifer]
MRFNKNYWLALFVVGLLPAQKQKFTMSEAVNGLRSNLAIKNLPQLQWAKDGSGYIHSVKNAYMVTEYPSMKSDTLISLYQINQNLTGGRKLFGFPNLNFINNNTAYFSQDNTH